MDIGEFLAARIAEDEHETRWMGTCDCAIEGFPLQHGLCCPERVLADCESKRGVVAYAQEVFRRNESAGTRRTLARVEADLENLNLMAVLRLLATPYADHRDYQPEWKP